MDESDPLATVDLTDEQVRGPIRLLTEWSTGDAQLAETLRMIAAMPVHTPERHEAEAFLHMTQARAAWREADRLRTAERRRKTPRVAGPDDGRRQVRKGKCVMCDALVRLRADGTVRVHDVGSGAAATRSGPVDRCVGAGLAPKT